MTNKVQVASARSFQDVLAKIAIYTAVPADLLAITPVLVRLFDKSFSWSGNVQVEEIRLPALNISIGRDFFIVLVVYAVIAFIYWLTLNIRSKSGRQKYGFIRVLSISIPLTFLMPFLLILISFRSIQTAIGLALFFVCAFITIVTYFRWSRDNSYKDMGLSYLLMVPFIWLFLQSTNPELWLRHLGWAWMYAALGYLFSAVTVGTIILFFIMPISHLGFTQAAMEVYKSFANGSWNVQNNKFWRRTLDLFRHFYKFDFDNGWVAIGTLAMVVLVGVVAFLILLIKILLTILVAILVLVGIGIASYQESQSRS